MVLAGSAVRIARPPSVCSVRRVKKETPDSVGFVALAALAVNTIVGSGIFRLPSELVRDLGSLSPAAFVVGAIVLLPIALSFARASRRVSGDGGTIAYVDAAFGGRGAVTIGVAIYVATLTTLASTVAAIPGQLASGISPRVAAITGAGVIAALGALSTMGRRTSGFAGAGVAALKVGALLIFAAAGLFFAPKPVASVHTAHPSNFGGSLLVVVYALSGFEAAAVPSSRNVPRALVGSLVGAALLYSLVQLGILRLLPDAGASERPLADATGVLVGPAGSAVVGVVGAVSLLGLAQAMSFTAPIVLRVLADSWPKSEVAGHVGRHAVLLSTALAASLALVLDFRTLIDFTGVLVMVQYALTGIAAARLDGLGRGSLVLGALAMACAGFVVAHASLLEISLAGATLAIGALFALRVPASARRLLG